MTRKTNTRGPSYRLIFAMMAALALIALTAYATWRYMAPEPAARTTLVAPLTNATRLR